MTWQYLIVKDLTESILNTLGKEGYELVSCCWENGFAHKGIFKRPTFLQLTQPDHTSLINQLEPMLDRVARGLADEIRVNNLR